MDRNAFMEKIKEKMGELDNQIDQLQVKADKAGEDVRHQWEKRKLELKERRQELSGKLDELRNSADSRFDELKASVEKTWESATKGLKDIKDNLLNK